MNILFLLSTISTHGNEDALSHLSLPVQPAKLPEPMVTV